MSRILPFRWSCLAVAILLSLSAQVSAQDAFKQFKQLDTTPRMPKLKAFVAPGTSTSPVATLHDVALDAKLTPDAQPIQQGLSWYVFSPTPGGDGKLPLLASSSGGSAAFHLAAGDYFVNVSFGRAGVTKKLTVPASGETQKQVMVLDAGGMLLNAVSGSDVRIPPDELSFSIYANDVKEDGTRGLIMSDVKPNTLVGLSAGTYHVVSEYGNVNAVIRADIQIEAGHITQATIQHRAAKITLKLVADAGGEAMADTAWSILTAAGDIVGESVSAFPTLILAEGKYSVVARNKDKIYQRDFTVAAGRNTDVEVLMSGQQPQDAPDAETDQQAEPIPQVQQQPSPTQVQSPNQVQSAPQTAPQEQEPLPAGDTGTSMD